MKHAQQETMDCGSMLPLYFNWLDDTHVNIQKEMLQFHLFHSTEMLSSHEQQMELFHTTIIVEKCNLLNMSRDLIF